MELHIPVGVWHFESFHSNLNRLHKRLSFVLQSQAWPSCVKVLGSWFNNRQRNAVFGLWGTCTFAGGVMGTALAVIENNNNNNNNMQFFYIALYHT